MNCVSFRQQASLYLDRQLPAEANQEFLFHLNSCAGCYEYVDEIRQTAQILNQLGPALPPADLAANILANLNAARACQATPPSLLQQLHTLVFYSRPQFISYATGFIITCFLFAGVIYGFRPQLRVELTDTLVSAITQPVQTIDLPVPTLTDTMPSVQSSSAIAELTVPAFQQTPTKDLFVVAEVSTEGRAELIQLVDAPKNLKLERHVAAALKRASFRPATKAGRPVNTRMLLLIQTIDVRG